MKKSRKSIDFVYGICYTVGSYKNLPVMRVQIPTYLFVLKEHTDMISREVTIKNNVGLHARPATFFIQKANSFRSSIWVEREDRRVNAKSLLGVLSLGIVKGTTITLIADGSDEQDALDGLAELIDTGFND